MSKVAVIDLGTNTFHLLIADFDRMTGSLVVLWKERKQVRLASDGIGLISEAAIQRASKALRHFAKIIERHESMPVRAIGTAALRTASNAPVLLRRIEEETGLKVEVVDGMTEARLIYRGTQLLWGSAPDTRLIMDIGGGSVEFIAANDDIVYWTTSTPIGVAVLQHHFQVKDTLTPGVKAQIETFLDPHLQELQRVVDQHQIKTLIGASGTFDVVAAKCQVSSDAPYTIVSASRVHEIIGEINAMSYEQLVADPLIPSERVDMIVVALVLLEKVLSLGPMEGVAISRYALKEGVVADYFSFT